jgi:hypothetical protein
MKQLIFWVQDNETEPYLSSNFPLIVLKLNFEFTLSLAATFSFNSWSCSNIPDDTSVIKSGGMKQLIFWVQDNETEPYLSSNFPLMSWWSVLSLTFES